LTSRPSTAVSAPDRTISILSEGRNLWRRVTAEASGVLVDAADYYQAFSQAAGSARHYLALSGWQFDSGVRLLRGDDAPLGREVRFLKFLNGLCARTPSLSVYILAWDFHLVFALEREWLQRVIFRWSTSPRLHFRFDHSHPAGGSHHQKFVVVDGRVAFLGGIDICESRWDDRCHRCDNPWRTSRGRPSKAYHDLQAYLAGGDAPRALADLFRDRWVRAGGELLHLPEALEPAGLPLAPSPARRNPATAAERRRVGPVRGEASKPYQPVAEPTRPMGTWERPAQAFHLGAASVGLSRTDPCASPHGVREIEHLLLDAIAAATRLLYIETQYFSSGRVCAALAQRMQAVGSPALEIVIVVNERAEALKEELAVGLRQARNFQRLREVAARTGHALGLYYPVCAGAGDTLRATYIHSKLLIVDDRFLTVGSANLTNRSMGVDSELQVSWEAGADGDSDGRHRRAIRRLRVSLLAEHSGLRGASIRTLVAPERLVARLNALADGGTSRLRQHGPPTAAQEAVLNVVDPEDLPFDPATPADAAPHDEPVDEPTRPPTHRLWPLMMHRAVNALTGVGRAVSRRQIR
jgi:phosphatidylserine/phosphatidylglycerophosphate/cardiolipin synthase-like enzyme